MTSFKRSGHTGRGRTRLSLGARAACGALGMLGVLGVLASCGAAQPVPPPTAHGGGPPALTEPSPASAAVSAATEAPKPARPGAIEALQALERDVAAAEQRWDWPGAFARFDDPKGADPDEVAIQRTRATVAFEAFVDDTLAAIVTKGSAQAVLGDRRAAFLASVDPARMPSDVGVAIYARERKLRGALLVFDRLEGGALLETPATYWSYGAAATRSATDPELAGKPLRRNSAFLVVARGKLEGVAYLAIGTATDGALERLESISALVVASSARPYETAAYLPPDLQPGDHVLASFAPWPTQLVLHEVLAIKNDTLSIRPLVGGAARSARREELRADFLPAGVAVLVPVATTFKRGLLETRLDDEQAVVTLEGARQTVPIASLRVEARSMPPAPTP